jgi:TorA-specific chaperone
LSVAADADGQEADPGAFLADWLATLFIGPVHGPALASFDNGADAAVLEYLDGIDDFQTGVASMRTALAGDRSAGNVESRLTTAFTLLFEGPGGPNTVPPYASAFSSRQGDWFPDPRSDMQSLLRRHDLSVGTALREPADHISIQLAVLAHLQRLGSDGAEDALRLVQHLRDWVPDFAMRCAETDRSGFYAGAAAVLVALIAPEAAAPR